MNDGKRYIDVAVSGPINGTFVYHLPEQYPSLQPGQRLLVPFGRSRKVGFYLGPSHPTGSFTIKDIITVIDEVSFFPAELVSLCRWMADYYFANPADCFAAALPPLLKTAVKPKLIWQTLSAEVPESVRKYFKTGRQVSAVALRAIRSVKKTLLRTLINEGVISEQWTGTGKTQSTRVIGYRCEHFEQWTEFFSGKKITPSPFDGIKTKRELLEQGWTAYYIAAAVKHGILQQVHSDRFDFVPDFLTPRKGVDAIALTKEQQDVYTTLKGFFNPGETKFQPVLLHGVTGSGKTLIYCHIARDIIQSGGTVLVLTPEIALAGTTLAYFRGFFGDRVTVLHSAMTDRERLASFMGIRSGKYSIVVGPRSAIFAPLPNLQLIIVDEEHDPSYKQDDPAPRFHGRDSAVMRAKIHNIPIILGSASPSLESYYQAQQGKYTLLELTKRPAGAKLPTVRIVDMKTARLGGDLLYFSHILKKEVESRLQQNEQVILFLNRRGYSPQLKCGQCGHIPTCPNCQVKLTYHKVGGKLSCHYCGWVSVQYDVCPKCQSPDFIYPGTGTQKVEENLPRLFPHAVSLRLDSDTATGRKKLYDILSAFMRGDGNLLLGTQMVTKGLDLPRVTLVGVLSADLMLDLPDFRASERTFSQLLQVAGRSGRAEKPGEVIIQTYYPENDIITLAANQQYRAFFERELETRESLSYPPFTRMVRFIISGKKEKQVEEAALTFREHLQKNIHTAMIKLSLLGPAPCPMYYLRGMYRRHVFVKTRQPVKLVQMLREWERVQSHFGLPTTIKLTVDVDPVDMM